jgi:hypothetical protein
MLRAMSRFAVLALLMGLGSACGNGGKSSAEQKNSTTSDQPKDEVVVVPGAKGGPAIGGTDGSGGTEGAQTGAPTPNDPTKLSDATKQRAKNPAFNLTAAEGTLTVAKATSKAGAAATTEIKLAPGSGYHVATDYPIKLWLEPPAQVKVDKTFLTAGGRTKAQGDAATLTEQALAFAVTATPAAAGAYEITGVLSFGICEKDSCHPKTQPITIQVAAN